MGPAAGADFVRLFVESCTQLLRAAGLPVNDQAYPEHWLAQVPVPDRTEALRAMGRMPPRPLESMKLVAARLGALGARTLAIACNTAHAWHASLQECFPDIDVIDGVRETALAVAHSGVREAGLLATEGTYASRLYDDALERAGVRCHVPTSAECALVMEGIYRGVKAGDLALARERFASVAHALAERHGCRTLVLGCTEIPLALTGLDGLVLVDPARTMARALALRAYRVESDVTWGDIQLQTP
jgi:aspartate racemase